jgi:hypothetical protein
MRQLLAALSAAIALLGSGVPSSAHHYLPMFDQEHPMQLVGTVKELRYMGPHTFIILEVKDGDGGTQVWNLEGGPPGGLALSGWLRKALQPGDELELMIDPLRSGERGGAWNVNKMKFKDGRPVIVPH